MRRLRVGVILSSLQDMGGAVRVAVSLANRMADDYDVVVYETVTHSVMAFPVDERVRCVSLGLQEERLRTRIPEAKRVLCAALEQDNVDVLLGIGVEETTIALLPCRRQRVKLVFCDHGALINQLDDRSTTFLRFVCARFCERTVVLTSQTLDDYRRIFHLGKRKLVRIANWIPRTLIGAGRRASIDGRAIVWAGRLDREKGVDLLFEVARRVMPHNPDWRLDVYGAAVLDEDGFDLAVALEEEGIADAVHLCGAYSDVSEVLPRYAIGVLTSYREGLPLFLLEGMAFGLPLVSFDVNTGPRDLIEEGKTGYLVEPYDCDAYAMALQKLIDDESLRASMSQAAYEKAAAFAEDSIYPQWRNLIESV